MTKKLTTKPVLLLLDANVVFRTHELGVWESLIDGVDIILPSSVAYAEVVFTKKGDKVNPLDMRALAEEGRIQIVEADASDLAATLSKFDRLFADRLDPGEHEALALIDQGVIENAHFCTTDGPAIAGLAMLGHSDRGISLETALKMFGLQQSNLIWPCKEEFFQGKIEEGHLNLVQGTGLRRD